MIPEQWWILVIFGHHAVLARYWGSHGWDNLAMAHEDTARWLWQGLGWFG